MSNPVPGVGNPRAKVIILGEAPGFNENEQKLPFVGASGEILEGIFEDLKIPDWRQQFYITNVYKFQPPNNDLKRIDEVCNPQEQKFNLWKEIRQIAPNVIIALGKVAFEAVTNKSSLLDYRGSILPSLDGMPKVIPTIHPSNLTNKEGGDRKVWPYIWRTILALDIKKALEESESNKPFHSSKTLLIANEYYDLYKFFQRNQGRKKLFTDVETYRNTVITCMSFAFDRHESISIVLPRQIERLQLVKRSDTEQTAIWRLIDEVLRSHDISGHNIKFDAEKVELLGFKYGKIFSDTVIKSHVANPELPEFNLGFLQSIYTREPFHKNEGKEFQYGKNPIEELLLYNAKDSAVQAELDEELDIEFKELDAIYGTDLSSFYSFMMELYPIYQEMERTGFKKDVFKNNYLRIKYDLWQERLEKELFAIWGEPFNLGSWQQVGLFLYSERGLDLPLRYKKGKKGNQIPKTDEDTMAQLLANVVKTPWKREAIGNMLTWRRVAKTKSTYIEMETDYDGRYRSTYRQAGTENGRTSTGIISPPVRPYESGFAFQTLTKHGDIGADIRQQLIADEGFIFVQIDKSQAEPRVVALLSEDYDLLKAFDSGIDIHRRTAALALELTDKMVYDKICPAADALGKDSPERFIGKKTRNGGNYNMGKREFVVNITSDARRFKIDINISEWRAEQILNRFHAANEKVRGVFHKQIQEAIDRQQALVSPYGRLRRFFGRMDDRIYKEAYACIPQATVKDSLNENMRDIWNIREIARAIRPVVIEYFGYTFMGEAHDAVLLQMPIGEYKDICKEIKPIMMKEIDFSRCTLKRGKLVIPVDFEVGTNYKDLEKLKW